MKIALIGLPQVGKKTVFSLLTGVGVDHLLARGTEYHVGAVKVADPRVDKLTAMYQPKKTKYAEIECTLAPAPPHEPKPREQWLNKLKDMDAFCHIVRAFEDPAVFHMNGTVDPLRDIDAMNLELAISDLSLIETRLNRIAQDQKKKFDQERADEAALLEKLKPHLEAGKSLREYPWHEGEEKRMRSLQFLTVKGIVTALNCGESNFPNPQLVEQAKAKLTGPRSEVCALSAKTEAEVAQIESPTERAEFLSALGVTEPAIHVLTRALYKALGYISFFTTGEDEVRAWTIRHGATAVEAAHAIHSDIARGFIRAEVMKYPDVIGAGDTGHAAEVKLKETGKLYVKGKDYIVEDGDTVHIRHSG
jgi:ribosome-binding ATPase